MQARFVSRHGKLVLFALPTQATAASLLIVTPAFAVVDPSSHASLGGFFSHGGGELKGACVWAGWHGVRGVAGGSTWRRGQARRETNYLPAE